VGQAGKLAERFDFSNEPMKYEEALREAAQRKGSPLSDEEKRAVYRDWEIVARREELRERFLKVIRLAGYHDGAPEKICNEYLDEYMKNIPEFVAMMEDYERRYAKDGEII
jgi:hypothetical protein